MMKVIKDIKTLSARICVLSMKVYGRLRYLKEANEVRTLWVAYYYLRTFLKWKDDDSFDVIVENKDIVDQQTIWIYWRQGFDQAPPLVKKCIISARQYAGNYRVVLLNDSNRRNYIRFPDFIEKKHDEQVIKEALFSDMLRISLLTHYGGVWCDATCLWTAELPEIVEKSDFFMFSESELQNCITPTVGSSWFIKAKKSDLILSKTRNCMFNYWYRHNFLPHYFVFHLFLALIVRQDDEAKEHWNAMPYICNMNPHVMQFSFHKPYTQQAFDAIKSQCFIHKLTYKFDQSLLERNNKGSGDNILQHILSL